MADNASTLGIIAGQLADALSPLTDRMTDDEILELLGDLGFVFPPELVGKSGIGPALTNAAGAAGALPGLIDALAQAAQGDLDTLLGAIDDLIRAIGTLLTALDAFANAVKAVANDLPGISEADVLAFVADLVSNLLDYLIVVHLESFFPRLRAFLSFLGVVEIFPTQTPTTPPQPLFTRRRVRYDRIGQLLKNPQDFMAEVYKWGAQDFDDELLLSRLATLLFSFQLPARLLPPTSSRNAILQLLLINVQKRTDLSPPGLEATLAFDLLDQFVVTVPFPVDGWTVELAQQGRIDAGLSVTITPPGHMALIPPVPNAQVSGKTSLAVIAQKQSGPLNILVLPRIGSVVSQKARAQIGLAYAADASGIHGEPVLELKLEGARFAASTEKADAFSQKLLPSDGASAGGVDFGLGWSPSRGVFFTSGGLETTIPINTTLGPFTIDLIRVRAGLNGDALKLDIGITGRAQLGPVAATVDGLGLSSTLTPGRGRLGAFDLSEDFLFPKGVGIAIDGGAISGGGFLSFDFDAGRYSGAIELEAYSISIKAFGLIETKVPGGGFSFVVVISTEFATPIQLGLGFTLVGVGGLIGINRTVDSDALRALVVAGRTENLLFPKNVIANAPAIIRDLGTVFPARQGHYVFGPLAKLGWGTPTLITAELALILELPGPVLSLIGEVKCLLPKPELALVKFNMSIAGQLDFPHKTFSLDAALHDSIIDGYPVSGQMAMRLRWGEQPNFALSVGGFHPAYQPPPNFPKLQPMTVALAQQGSTSVTVSGFFALTSNTLQIGGEARLHAGGSGISLDASIAVKTIFIFSPFSFAANIDASVKISFHGHGPSVHLSGVLSGPSPWRAKGEVCVSILWWDACLRFDQTFGGATTVPEVVIDPWLGTATVQGLKPALEDPKNWATLPPPGSFAVVSRAPGANDLVDPLGGFTVRQKALPVETTLPVARFGPAKAAEPPANRTGPIFFNNGTGAIVRPAPAGNLALTKLETLKDFFAPAQFFELNEAKKLSAKSFDKYGSGYSFAINPNNLEPGSSAPKAVTYTTVILGSGNTPTQTNPGDYNLPDTHLAAKSRTSAVARGGFAQSGARRYIDPSATQPFAINDTGFALAHADTLKPLNPGDAPLPRADALVALDNYIAQHPDKRGQIQVVTIVELAA
jgi:hypothetical protein